MECEEETVDSRVFSEDDYKTGDENSRLLFTLNHTMPMTEEYSSVAKDLFGGNLGEGTIAGEQYNVGKISEGNTEIIAEMIADETDSDLFRIESVRSYSVDDHRALLDEARTEQRENARPALKSDVQNFERYGTVYIGYPIWWGDIPMPVYTFLESHDWSGKTVVPFATHEGSGLSGTERNIRSSCRNADVLKGLSVRGRTAQTNRASARKEVRLWLEHIRKK